MLYPRGHIVYFLPLLTRIQLILYLKASGQWYQGQKFLRILNFSAINWALDWAFGRRSLFYMCQAARARSEPVSTVHTCRTTNTTEQQQDLLKVKCYHQIISEISICEWLLLVWKYFNIAFCGDWRFWTPTKMPVMSCPLGAECNKGPSGAI